MKNTFIMKNIKSRLSILLIKRRMFFLISFLVLLISCTSAEKQWEEAKKANTIERYELFLADYPESEFVHEAQNAKSILEENNLWSVTKSKNTIEGYELFISKYPEGTFAQIAQDEKSKLEEQLLWQEVKSTNKISNYISFLKNYPESDYIAELLIKSETQTIPFANVLKKNYYFSFSKSSKSNYLKSSLFIPGGTRMKTSYGVSTVGGTGLRASKDFKQTSIEEIIGEFIEFSPFIAVFINKSNVLLSGEEVTKFKRLSDNKISISEGSLYLVTLKTN